MKGNMRLIFTFLVAVSILMLFGYQSNAQQQTMYTQYMFNQLAINPAYAGSHESMEATFLQRKQWWGLEGSPTTQSFTYHTPINERKISLGFLFNHDKIGVEDQLDFNIFYAYRLQFKNGGNLAFGLQGGAASYRLNYTDDAWLTKDGLDPAFPDGEIEKSFLPNFGAGVYYNSEAFYMGFSVPRLLNNAYSGTVDTDIGGQKQHFFFNTGVVFGGDNIKWKPNVMAKYVQGAPVSIDINLNALIRDALWVGVSHRLLESFQAILELQLTEQLRIGGAYDFATLTEIRPIQYGSWEVMLNYVMTYSKSKIATPRYF